ncbi:MAG: hypothetical protein ACLTE2_03025 [Eubacteriales bacterium]
MKLARGIVSILMFMLLFSFMSLPVFAMQTQSNGRTGSSEQSSVGSKQNVSGTMETGSEETTSVSSEDSTSQDNSLSQSSEISLPEVSVDSEAAGIISKGTDATPSNNFRPQTWLGSCRGLDLYCNAFGISIVAVVIVAGKTRNLQSGGTGKKRYERKPMTPKGKRILNEKYYRNIKK